MLQALLTNRRIYAPQSQSIPLKPPGAVMMPVPPHLEHATPPEADEARFAGGSEA